VGCRRAPPRPPTLEIARALGVSRAHVSRMLRRALEHLRTLDAADAA
jgi:DNA-directed RNA polymerase specialized sigma24 family protein